MITNADYGKQFDDSYQRDILIFYKDIPNRFFRGAYDLFSVMSPFYRFVSADHNCIDVIGVYDRIGVVDRPLENNENNNNCIDRLAGVCRVDDIPKYEQHAKISIFVYNETKSNESINYLFTRTKENEYVVAYDECDSLVLRRCNQIYTPYYTMTMSSDSFGGDRIINPKMLGSIIWDMWMKMFYTGKEDIVNYEVRKQYLIAKRRK